MTIILFGLDGASLDNLRTVMGFVELPNFRMILQGGQSAGLRSVYPYVTAPAWTSLFSGVNPGKHGIFDLIEVEGEKVGVPNMRRLEIPLLWEYLSWAGKKVLVLGMPFIHPAPQINGVFVTGRLVPELSCTPSDTRTLYDLSGFSPGKDHSKVARIIQGGSPQPRVGGAGLSKGLVEALVSRMKASLSLIDSSFWDAVLIVDSLPDQLYHKSYRDREVISQMFIVLDQWLGELLGRMKDLDTLLIVSDHGFGDVSGVFFLNEWLRSRKYVMVSESLSNRISRQPMIRRATRVFRRFEGSPSKLRGTNERSGAAARTRGPEGEHVLVSRKPLPGSKVAVRGVASSAWIKLLEYSSSLEESILGELAETKRLGLVRNVFKTRELYSGKYSLEAPGELLIEPGADWSIDTERITYGRPFRRFREQRGAHKLDGLLIVKGNFTPTLRGTANICDITPTILDLLGLPIPRFMDGISLSRETSRPSVGRLE